MREKALETNEEKLARLHQLRDSAIHHASEKAVEKQHAKGKYTARERIEKLLDPGSFQELDTYVRHRTHEFEIARKTLQKYRVDGGRSRHILFQQELSLFLILACLHSQPHRTSAVSARFVQIPVQPFISKISRLLNQSHVQVHPDVAAPSERRLAFLKQRLGAQSFRRRGHTEVVQRHSQQAFPSSEKEIAPPNGEGNGPIGS